VKKVAKILIVDQEEMHLLLYRSEHPRFGVDPDLPGGLVEENESFLETMLREVKEEVGVDIRAKDTDVLYSGTDYSSHNSHFELFITHVKTRPNILLSWEHSSYIWLSKTDFLEQAKIANDKYMRMVYDTLSASK
jgi:8-oxo-dGTP pyrophosphatase MutT (NUDIX family)